MISLLFIIAGTLIGLLTLAYLIMKHMIAWDHCEGGAPILDSLLVTPFMTGITIYILGRGIGSDINPAIGSALSLPLVCLSLWGTWKLSQKNKMK